MVYPGTLGRYLLINYPDAAEAHSVHVKYVDGVEQCQLVGWLPDYGDPPSPEQVAAWEAPPLPQLPLPDPVSLLPSLDSARQAKWLAAREASADALLAEGWSLEQTMQAGAEFVNAYAALSFGYWYGGAAGTTPQTNLLLAIQADTEREWLDVGSPTVREQMLAILQ